MTMNNARLLPFVATMMLLFLFDVSPTNSFQISTPWPCVSSALKLQNHRCFKPNYPNTNTLSQPFYSSIVLRSSEQANEEDDNTNLGGGGSLDLGGILGSIASIVVLYSEFVLKTTGCGLPAGPFGIVGAVEGVSYLGVVATCAAAAVDYFSEDGLEGSENITRRLATSLGILAALVGIVVLVLQVTDYGYIPNAVPMEGGMCK